MQGDKLQGAGRRRQGTGDRTPDTGGIEHRRGSRSVKVKVGMLQGTGEHVSAGECRCTCNDDT